jgi:formylglycine-generating enzyme required for sulfatase activity
MDVVLRLLIWTAIVLLQLQWDDASAQAGFDPRAREGVVRISVTRPDGESDVGAGIVVGVQGSIVYVATALHVLSGPEESWDRTGFDRTPDRTVVSVLFAQQPGLTFAGRILPRWDRRLDLAVVTVDDPRTAQLGVSIGFALGGANVLQTPYRALAIGHPGRTSWAVSEVAVTEVDRGQVRMADARLDRGYSGGALLDQRRGMLVGMLQAVSVSGSRALTMETVVQQLRAWNVPIGLGAANVNTPMVRIQGGTFTMGSRYGPNDAQRERAVTLDAYYMDKYEVTAREFRRFVEESGYIYETNLPTCNYNTPANADLPMNCVTWFDAQAFARWAGKALPTEAQWEFAARGPSGRLLPWGNGTIAPGDAAVGVPQVALGGSFPKDVSAFGVADMLGNVSEWTADWYARSYFGDSDPRSPTAPIDGEDRVIRGASYSSEPERASLLRRHRDLPDSGRRKLTYGFRCVLNGS